MAKPSIRAERRSAEELTDSQIERLMQFGRLEADLNDHMEEAARAGDRNLVWQIAQALVEIEDQRKASEETN